VVSEEGGKAWVWTGRAGITPVPLTERGRTPLSYPTRFAEKILTAWNAREGESTRVSKLFAALTGAMEVLADGAPEAARAFLNPGIERLMTSMKDDEGTVKQVMGDGGMALCGAPIAYDD
jgi:class 3 adenylate cyclase